MAYNERKRRSRTRTLSVEGLELRNLQSQINTVLSIPNFQINEVPSIGPGDADVDTHTGRKTEVRVTTGPINIQGGGSFAQFTLVYRIHEVSPDYTTLEWRDNVILPAPFGRIVAAGQGTQPVNYDHIFVGAEPRLA